MTMEILPPDEIENLNSKPFGILSPNEVFVSVRKLFAETTMMLAARTPNRFGFRILR